MALHIPGLLSIVTEPDGDVVSVHADVSGLRRMRTALDSMITSLEAGCCDHFHFRSDDWAGSELTISMLPTEQQHGCKQVHHLKIHAWTPDWKEKHGL